MQLTDEHRILGENARRFVQEEIDPHVERWEAERTFPAHELFRKLGSLGLLGVTKPEEVGGLGLDYSYAAVVHQEMGRARCGGVPMAIGVQTDMATPALARFGSDEVKRRFLAPTVSGEAVACIGVSEPGAGSDVAAIRTRGGARRRRLRHQRQQDVDHQTASRPTGCACWRSPAGSTATATSR